MKKKGFTLVELLAVIAILAILVIIALPNVLELYKNARKNAFANDVSNIVRTAKQQYFIDGSKAQSWTNISGSTKKMGLNTRDGLQYFVQVDDSGNVIKLQVTDGSFQYVNNDLFEEVNIDDVIAVNGLDDSEILVIVPPRTGEVYVAYDGNTRIGGYLPSNTTYYNSAEEALAVSNRKVFMKYVTEDDKVIEAYIGFTKNNNIYYIQGGPGHLTENLSTVESLYGSCSYNTDSYYCGEQKFKIAISESGNMYVSDTSSGCYVGCHINSSSTYCDGEDIFC